MRLKACPNCSTVSHFLLGVYKEGGHDGLLFVPRWWDGIEGESTSKDESLIDVGDTYSKIKI